ncbi:MAG: tRNA (adenosine(37)-N6)-threonylcarbamoyltransferase complex dimerization subunit type 1 TsaB [Clostridia bacterium]|nr:tRNA (adenosine(37)-N6)-threonylcarbamoyltransferase complex dimerization subunit type 1 TsaB [Clostridia bacterium]
MILLSMDASAKSAAVAVSDGDMALAENFINNGYTHSETLLPLVAETLEKAGKTIGEVEAFAVTNGPGSFTGLRIGCATVKGLAGNRPCYPVPTLLALAYSAGEDGLVIPMMDARRQQTYTAVYRVTNGKVEQLIPDRAIAVAKLEEEMAEYLAAGERIVVPGDGGYLLSEEMKAKVFFPAQTLITATGVALAAQEIHSVPAGELGLRYLRLSQAEREKKEKKGVSL